MQDSAAMTKNLFLQSDAHGRIECLLLTIPSWALRYQDQVEIRGTADAYRSVLGSFQYHVRFLLVTHREGEALLEEWLREFDLTARTQVVTVPDRTKLSVWAQDSFLVCSDGTGETWVLEPDMPEHPGESLVAASVAEAMGWKRAKVHRSLQSGNILVGDDFWLLGADSAWDATRSKKHARAADTATLETDGVIQQIHDPSKRVHIVGSGVPVPGSEEELQLRATHVNGNPWREAVFRGNRLHTAQPLFHIDSFITPAGRGEDGRYRVLVGDPAIAAEVLGCDLPDHAMRAAFDDCAARLEGAGFAVLRNPLPLVYADNHITKVRHWYFASSNNAIVEIDGTRRSVWLPTYGHGRWKALEATDRRNEEIWREMGFETSLLGDFHPFISNLGALRCMTKCLVRSRL